MSQLWSYPVGAKLILENAVLEERAVRGPVPVQIGDVQYGVDIFEVWTDGELAEKGILPAAPPEPDPDAAILGQIAALEAMQTPRLLREAMKKKAVTVNKPGSIIHGLSPYDAVDAIDSAVEALRAQLVGQVFYQVEQLTP